MPEQVLTFLSDYLVKKKVWAMHRAKKSTLAAHTWDFKFPTRNSIIIVISFLHNCSVYLTMLWFRIRAQTHNPIKTKEERGVHHLFMVVTVWLQQANCEWSLLVLSVCLLQIVYSIDMQCMYVVHVEHFRYKKALHIYKSLGSRHHRVFFIEFAIFDFMHHGFSETLILCGPNSNPHSK